MARQASDINPDDVYLPSNLGPGDPWARQVVNDLIALKKDSVARRLSESGANRGDAASRASIANQINSVLRVSVGGFKGNVETVFFNGTTGSGSSVYWTNIPEIIPSGFTRLSILNVLNVEGIFPNLEPIFGFTYRAGGVPITGVSKVSAVALGSPGPLLGNASPNVTSVGRCDAREFDITGSAGLNFQVGYNVGFFSGSVPVPNQTITPDVSGSFQILYHN